MNTNEDANTIWAWCPECMDRTDHTRTDHGLACACGRVIAPDEIIVRVLIEMNTDER